MILDSILLIVLGICFVTDLKYQKIYNKVIFPALIISILLNTFFYNLNGLKLSLLGFAAGFSLLLIPYLLGGIGAGDIKLLALIGAIKGSAFVINTAIYMALIGGIVALVIILSRKEFFNFIKSLVFWVVSLLNGTVYKPKFPTSIFLSKYPYGTAIAGGALICLIFKGAWIV